MQDSKQEFKYNENFHYEYRELVHDVVRVKVEFSIRLDRLKIIQDLLNIKYNGIFPIFVQDAIINQVESDLHNPESIAKSFCKRELEKWNSNMVTRKSLQAQVDYW